MKRQGYLMKNFSYRILKYLLTSSIIFASLVSKASTQIIYDSETQNIINKIALPIFKEAKLKRPEIYVITDPSPNAFTAGGEVIYIHSGLITKFPDPNILRGVIAHEVGHISAKHVIRSQNFAYDKQKIAMSSLLLGIVGSAITGDPSIAMQGAMIGSHTAERSILKYSRENEMAADIKAEEYLKKAGYNSTGLISLLEYFGSQHKIPEDIRYDLTHPVFSERIYLIKSRNNEKRQFVENPEITKQYEMVAAKLSAYTTNFIDRKKFSKEAIIYAESIIEMRKSHLSSALDKINLLIARDKNNSYLYQLKAEILTFFGNITALEEFEKAIAKSEDILLKIEFAIAKIKLANNKDIIKEAIFSITSVPTKYLNNNTILDYLSIGYDKLGQSEYSLYYRALAKKNIGDIKLAKKLAREAKSMCKNNSILSLKCDDILSTEE